MCTRDGEEGEQQYCRDGSGDKSHGAPGPGWNDFVMLLRSKIWRNKREGSKSHNLACRAIAALATYLPAGLLACLFEPFQERSTMALLRRRPTAIVVAGQTARRREAFVVTFDARGLSNLDERAEVGRFVELVAGRAAALAEHREVG